MPIYEYRCEKCNTQFERMQRMSDPEPSECPSCKQGPIQRMVSRTSFQLKGGGWYSDLYSSNKKDDSSGKSDTASTVSSTPSTSTAPAAPAAASTSTSSATATKA